MEGQVSRLLTAINAAESSSQAVNFSGLDIDDMASHSIAMLWENVHFRTMDDDIVTSCLTLKNGGQTRGYQVRNIEIEMKPLDSSAKASSMLGRPSHSRSADSRHSASACRAAGRLEERKIGTP